MFNSVYKKTIFNQNQNKKISFFLLYLRQTVNKYKSFFYMNIIHFLNLNLQQNYSKALACRSQD